MVESFSGHSKSNDIYHEKQNLLFCAKHTLNNLFQSKIFTKKQLDEVCESLTKTKLCYNPHRSFMRIGDYDINVIESALNSLGFQISWFDMRNDVSSIDLLSANQEIFGLIVNIKTSKFFRLSDSHWLAIKVINDIIYNLDSELDAPKEMSPLYLGEYLEIVKQKNGQVLIVRQNEKLQKLEFDNLDNLDQNELV